VQQLPILLPQAQISVLVLTRPRGQQLPSCGFLRSAALCCRRDASAIRWRL